MFELWLIEKGITYWYIDNQIMVDDLDLIHYYWELKVKFHDFKIELNGN